MAQAEDRIEELRAQYEHLHDLLKNHMELRQAFYNDATVHAWLKQTEMGRCTLEEAWIGIVVTLAQEKKTWFNKAAELSALTSQPFAIDDNRRPQVYSRPTSPAEAMELITELIVDWGFAKRKAK